MKKLLSALSSTLQGGVRGGLLILTLLATTTLWAYDFKSGNLYYNITSKSAPYTVEVTYQSSSYDKNYPTLTTATIPETVTYNGTIYSVTKIGPRALGGCSTLKSITIPNSIISIDYAAFEACSSLTSITIPGSVTRIGDNPFACCFSLTSIVVNSSNTTYDSRKNCNAIIETATNSLIVGCKNTIILNSVTSIGDGAFHGCSALTSVMIPNSVTSIGYRSFYGCSLTSLVIPNSVTSIGGGFLGCEFTTPVYNAHCFACLPASFSGAYTIPDGIKQIASDAFWQCKKLTSVTIPNSVESIGSWAFAYCSSLTSITMPNSVTSIEGHTFQDCSALTSITIPHSVTSIGNEAFSGCSKLKYVAWNAKNCSDFLSSSSAPFYNSSSITSFSFGNNVEHIPSNLCYGMENLSSVTIPNSVTSIGDQAFFGCSSLKSVAWNAKNCSDFSSHSSSPFYSSSSVTSFSFGNNVEHIPFYLCYGMSNLTSITIPNSVTSIGGEAFYGCSGLASVTIPNSVTNIGNYAFSGCSGLASVTIPNSVTNIGNYTFSGCSGLTSVTIPNSVTSIGEGAFSRCSGLTSVTIGNSVMSVGDEAFYGCFSLKSVAWNAKNCSDFVSRRGFYSPFYSADYKITSFTFGDSVQHIPAYLCYGVRNLTFLTIPSSVTSIGDEAFHGCSGLMSIISLADTPPTTMTTAFSSVNKTIPVYVPCGQVDVYQSSIGWSQFTNIQSVTYSIEAYSSNSRLGIVRVDDDSLCEVHISATANEGYHFTQWSDGNTANPRSLVLTQDTVLVAAFAINQYQLNVSSNNPEAGMVNGTGLYDHGTSAKISATANEGYHFTQWSDGNTETPRTLVLTQDTNLTAEFVCNTYMLTIRSNGNGSVIGSGTYNQGEVVTISATPNAGYHFVQWSDGNTDNPRSLVLTQDTTLTAEFAINTYTLTTKSNGNGSVIGNGIYNHGETVNISATADIGYHFVRWSDGNTDNPRSLVLTKDTELTAIFAKNIYSVNVSYNEKEGNVAGNTSAEYLESATITATPNIGYHFTQWADGNTDNPRTIVLTQDTTLTAEFAINTYTLTIKSNLQGNIIGNGIYNHGETVIISATADIGYHFVRWSDGFTDNPRTIVLTQDTVLTAEFAQSFSGQCGENLYWAYNESEQSLSISGTGDMYNYTTTTQPWILFKEKIKTVYTTNTVTSFGTSAFEGAIRLAEVYVGSAFETIEDRVFAGCTRLRNIHCYPTYPPIIFTSSFERYDANLYIPCDYLEDYTFDPIWNKFTNIQCSGAEKEEVENNGVEVDPSSTSVTMIWPTEEDANTYTIEIRKDGAIFCRLTFNTEGQLLNLSFAPARNGKNHAVQYATKTANGLRFTVTGLNESTHYTYNLKAKDKAEKALQSYSGEFTTKSSNISSGVENTDTQHVTSDTRKIIRDNQLIILRDGVEYNAMGVRL